MKILIVEDDQYVAASLNLVLAHQNYVVEIALDGEEAWGFIKLFDYDLIILDISLPLLDGISLCRQMRSEGLQTPIMLLTGLNCPHEKAVPTAEPTLIVDSCPESIDTQSASAEYC